MGRVLYSDYEPALADADRTYDPTVKANSTLVTPNQCPTASNATYAAYNATKPHYFITDAQCTRASTS